MTKLSSMAVRRCASGLILCLALGAASAAVAQEDPGLPPPPRLRDGGEAPQPVSAPGMNRPMLQKTALVAPPAVFCSEREKLDFLLEVFYPAAQKATKNNIAAHDYLVKIRRLRDDAAEGPVKAAYQAELDAWTPIWKAADELAGAFLRLLDVIRAMPVVDCANVAALPVRGEAFAVRLETARAAMPAARTVGGEWGVAGEAGNLVVFGGPARADQPFDGSEAERSLRRTLAGLEKGGDARPGKPPKRKRSRAIPIVRSAVSDLPAPLQTVETSAPSTSLALEVPAVPALVLPAPTPSYPDCPTHPGMAGTPEHVREFHG